MVGMLHPGSIVREQRLRVFVDYQNTYMRAREAFGDESTRNDYTFGQIFPRLSPRRLGIRLRQMAEDGGQGPHARPSARVPR
jgi:hypothetical protein